MMDCLRSNPKIGIVGPMTNEISGIQKIPAGTNQSDEKVDEIARELRERNRNRRIPSRRIVGFCMLFRKELLDRVGFLDESFGTGNFEDDDFCLRAELAGYTNMIAGDVFVHHYGSRSFIGNQIDYRASMSGNRKIFFNKWSGIDPKSPVARRLLALKEKEKTWESYFQDRLEESAKRFLKALKISPQDEDLYLSFAEMLLDAKKYQEAADILKQMPQEKNHDRICALTGYCLEGAGKIEEADEMAKKALALNPGDSRALNLKGILAHRRGQKEEARAAFQKAVQADAGYGEPCTNLGVMEWETGQRDTALNFLERGFILSPTGTDNLQLYHSAASELGAFERAEKALADAEALYPGHKKIQFLLMDILLRQGKNEAAMDRIEKSIAQFGMDEGMLRAALEIRSKIGPKEIQGKSKRGTISLCMIVKDEEKYLARCLQSAKAVVDEMIVVDTGSSDRTKDLAMVFGAKVFDFSWKNDFSSARNHSLSKAAGDWILVLDADEVVAPGDQSYLRELTFLEGKDPIAYSFVTRNYVNGVDYAKWTPNDGAFGEEKGSGWFPSEKVRLFPRDPRFQFENAVHEVVEPAIVRHKIPIKKSPVLIHHFGKLDEEKTFRKGEDYFVLGKMKLEEKGLDPQSLKELAVQAGNLGRYEEAIAYWNQLLGSHPQLTEAYVNLGAIHMKQNRYPEAAEASRKALATDSSCQEALINYSLAQYWMGNLRETISCLEGMDANGSTHPLAFGLLSLSYILMGQEEKSRPLVQKLKSLGFDFESYASKSARELSAVGREKDGALLLEAIGEGQRCRREAENHAAM
jgi:tetratricopeptide (TPR) repeat protein